MTSNAVAIVRFTPATTEGMLEYILDYDTIDLLVYQVIRLLGP
jgi:hypothetical protein